MSKNPFDEADAEMQALRASMRPTAGPVRWGRVLTGMLVIGCVTFALAYYLPLARAHQELGKRFAELKARADAADRALEGERSKAKELGETHRALENRMAEVTQRDKQRADASQVIRSALQSKLEKPLAKNQATVAVAGDRVVAALSLDHLLTRGKVEIGAPGQSLLCSVAGAANKRSIRVVVVAEQKGIPANLSKTLKTPLQYSVAVAQRVAETLLDKCGVDAAHLSAAGVPTEPASSMAPEGKKLPGPRVELWLEGAP